MWPAPCPAALTFPSCKGAGTHLLVGRQENEQWPDSYPYQESKLARRCRRRVLEPLRHHVPHNKRQTNKV